MKKKQADSLKKYILHLNNWIPKNICKKTISDFKNNTNWSRHQWTDTISYNTQSLYKEKELDVLSSHSVTNTQKLHDITWKAIEKYILIEKIGGDLFKGWKGFSQIRFNRYQKDQKMAKHHDHITAVFDGKIKGIPILSIVGVLNDNYEGGEFIMFEDYEIKFKAGDILIFPSVFLYPHLVKPVKKGIRYSFVSWVF